MEGPGGGRRAGAGGCGRANGDVERQARAAGIGGAGPGGRGAGGEDAEPQTDGGAGQRAAPEERDPDRLQEEAGRETMGEAIGAALAR